MDEMKSNALLQHLIYRESEIINQQVVEMLVQSKDEDLLAYADFLDSNNTIRDEPMTRYDVCGVITRCLTLHSEECRTATEVVREFMDFHLKVKKNE